MITSLTLTKTNDFRYFVRLQPNITDRLDIKDETAVSDNIEYALIFRK